MSDETKAKLTPQEELARTGLAPEVLALLQLQPDPQAQELVLRDLRGSGNYIAIEKQNFNWMLAIARQVANLIIAGAFPAWAPGAIADLIFMLIDFREQSVELSAEEGAVLLELRKSGGLTAPELAAGVGLDEAKTKAILSSLANTKRRDGVPVQLVACDAQGTWTAPNV